jgi:hypothetical protein
MGARQNLAPNAIILIPTNRKQQNEKSLSCRNL